MKTSPSSPLHRSIGLLRRMLPAFPECALSLGWLFTWAREQLGLQRKWSAQAAAIGTDLGTAEALLDESLADDGLIDPREAALIRARLRVPARSARHLAAELNTPESWPRNSQLSALNSQLPPNPTPA